MKWAWKWKESILIDWSFKNEVRYLEKQLNLDITCLIYQHFDTSANNKIRSDFHLINKEHRTNFAFTNMSVVHIYHSKCPKISQDPISLFEWRPSGQQNLFEILERQRNSEEDICDFIVTTVPAGVLAPVGARTSADTMLTKFVSHAPAELALNSLRQSDAYMRQYTNHRWFR